MLTYPEAVAQAESGKGLYVSTAGGRTRFAMFTRQDDGTVTVRLFRTTIAEFTPEGVRLFTGGYNTATTVDALNALTDRIMFGTYQRRLYLDPYGPRTPFREGMMLSYDRMILDFGTDEPPLRPGRKAYVR